MFGIYFSDMKLEKDIKAISHMLGLDSKFTVDLVELLDPDPEDTYMNAVSLCSGACNDPKIAAAIVAIVKGDFSNIKILAERLGLDPKKLQPILAAAKGRTDLLEDQYS